MTAQPEPTASLPAGFDRFLARLRRRLAAGAREYGDASFTRPPAEIVDEIQQELEDVCGWSFILWLRLDRQRAAAIPSGSKKERSMAESPQPLLTGIEFQRASQADVLKGLLGWVSCVLSGALHLDRIAVRRTVAGRITLSFPEHRDRCGGRHARFRPLTDDVRERLEDEILPMLPPDIAAQHWVAPPRQARQARQARRAR